jgi:GAF domain-containing protein
VLTERRVIELRADDPGLPAASRDALADWGLTTTLDGPLVIGDEVIGVIGVAEARFARRFLTMEIQLFEQLAGMAAAAMRNARLSRRERRFSLHLETLLGLSRRVSAEADPHTVASAAAEAVTRVLGASFAAVYEIGSDGGPLLERAADPGEAPDAGVGGNGVVLGAGHAPDADAAARRAAVTTTLTEALLADGLDDAPSAAGPAPREGGPDVPPMLMAVTTAGIDDDVPDDMTALGEVTRLTLVTLRRGRPVAVLAAAWSERRGLDADDLDLARAIGDQVALAIDSDRLARA